jgi:hypothetical protein
MNFPKSFLKKNVSDMSTYIKSNEFQTLLKIKMNQVFNIIIRNQFDLGSKQPTELRKPEILEYVTKSSNNQNPTSSSELSNKISRR